MRFGRRDFRDEVAVKGHWQLVPRWARDESRVEEDGSLREGWRIREIRVLRVGSVEGGGGTLGEATCKGNRKVRVEMSKHDF